MVAAELLYFTFVSYDIQLQHYTIPIILQLLYYKYYTITIML